MHIDIGILVGVAGTAFGIVMTYLKYRKSCDSDIENDAAIRGELKADLNYIRRGIEEIRVELKAAEKRDAELSERVLKVELSDKHAHKRIDEILERIKE